MASNNNQDQYQSHNLDQSELVNSSRVRSKPQISKQRTKLYYFLQKINHQSLQKKRQCIINYLNNEGQLKDLQKSIKAIQKQTDHIPALQVALSLGKHNKNVLKQFLQANKEKIQIFKQNRISRLNSGNNLFVQLLQTQNQISNLKHSNKQPSFHQYKIVSPTKVRQMIDVSTGKFKIKKKEKVKYVQYPKQLQQLKNQLYSLPCLGKKKHQIKMKTFGAQQKQEKLKSSQVKHLSELNTSFKTQVSFSKKKKQFLQRQGALENNLNQVLQNRLSNINMQNRSLLPSLKPSIHTNIKMGQNTISSISVNSKYDYSSPLKNSSIYSCCQQNPQNSLLKSKKIECFSRQINIKQSYWPSYKEYSPLNNIKLQQQSQKLKNKINSLMQFNQMPNQQTVKMYFNIKKTQQQDLQQLKQNSLKEQKGFSSTKYKIKFRQIRQNNKRNFMQYAKDKKRRAFQQQKLDMIEMNNMSKKPIKLNSKLLERVQLSASNLIQNHN